MNKKIETSKEELLDYFLSDDKNITDNYKEEIEFIINKPEKLKVYLKKNIDNEIIYAWVYSNNKYWTYIDLHRTSPKYRKISTTKEVVNTIISILNKNSSNNIQFAADAKDKPLIKMYDSIVKKHKSKGSYKKVENNTGIIKYKIKKEVLEKLFKK